jgi:hypothetical protein
MCRVQGIGRCWLSFGSFSDSGFGVYGIEVNGYMYSPSSLYSPPQASLPRNVHSVKVALAYLVEMPGSG